MAIVMRLMQMWWRKISWGRAIVRRARIEICVPEEQHSFVAMMVRRRCACSR